MLRSKFFVDRGLLALSALAKRDRDTKTCKGSASYSLWVVAFGHDIRDWQTTPLPFGGLFAEPCACRVRLAISSFRFIVGASDSRLTMRKN
jgi:hypothetical protein